MQTTRYILAGGYDRARKGYAKKLGAAVDGRKKDKILSCFFSRPEHLWLKDFNSYKPFFEQVFPGSELELALPDKFVKQVGWADVIYLHGGDSKLLKQMLSKYKDIDKLFEGKTIVGSSAGANYLSKFGWSYNLRQAIEGAGITPLNTIVHYKSTMNDEDHRGPIDWDQPFQDITKLAGKDVEITPIPEGELVIYEV